MPQPHSNVLSEVARKKLSMQGWVKLACPNAVLEGRLRGLLRAGGVADEFFGRYGCALSSALLHTTALENICRAGKPIIPA